MAALLCLLACSSQTGSAPEELRGCVGVCVLKEGDARLRGAG